MRHKAFWLFVVIFILAFICFVLCIGAALGNTEVFQSGKLLKIQDEVVDVYHNIPVPPTGYIHGAMVSTIIRYYYVESEGRVYKLLPHSNPRSERNPLKMYIAGDAIQFRLDITQGRLYVIVPSNKGLSKQCRYDVVETQGVK